MTRGITELKGAQEAAKAIAGWYLEVKADLAAVSEANDFHKGEVVRLLKERTELLDMLHQLWGYWEPASAQPREVDLNERLEDLLHREGLL